jgi:hypothetical protein
MFSLNCGEMSDEDRRLAVSCSFWLEGVALVIISNLLVCNSIVTESMEAKVTNVLTVHNLNFFVPIAL